MRLFICCVLFLFIFSSCEKNYVEPKEILKDISFSTDIIPIFSSNCESCHTSGGGFPGLVLSSDIAYAQLWTDGVNAPYVDTINPSSSKLYTKMNSNMPPSGLLPNEKISIVLKWIELGAKNN